MISLSLPVQQRGHSEQSIVGAHQGLRGGELAAQQAGEAAAAAAAANTDVDSRSLEWKNQREKP